MKKNLYTGAATGACKVVLPRNEVELAPNRLSMRVVRMVEAHGLRVVKVRPSISGVTRSGISDPR